MQIHPAPRGRAAAAGGVVALLAGLTLTVASAPPADATGGPFTCTPGFFQVTSGLLNKLNPVTGVYTPVGSTYGDTYNAMGYDTLNNYLYAIDTGTAKGDLLKIAGDGSVTNLGRVTGLPAALSAVAGDFDADGDLIVQDTDKIYYSIDVSSMTATEIPISGSVASVDDLVYIGGYMYGMTGTSTVELLVVDLSTGVATEHAVSGITSSDGAFGAGFSDQPSDLFFSDNSGQGIYSISAYTTTTPSAAYEAPGAVTGNNDGAACKLAGSPFAGPTANADSYSPLAGQALTVDAAGGVIANDTGSEPLTVDTHTDPSHGTLTLNSDGSFTYTPMGSYSGPDSFTYVAEDPYGRTSSPATVSLSVLPAPQGQTDTAALDTEYTQAAPGLLTGAVGSSLTLTSNTDPAHGTVSVTDSTGAFTYTPDGGWSGTDAFTYTVKDLYGQTAIATVTMHVAPSVQPDSYSASGTTPLVVGAPGVLSNDEGAGLMVTSHTTPGNGTVSTGAGGSFTYTAAAGFSGTDTFQYTAADGSGLTGTATVTIQVMPAPGSPGYSTPADAVLNVAAPQGVVAASDGSGLGATQTSGPSHGSLSLSIDGAFTYTPSTGYSGHDSFGFVVTDSHGQPAFGTASITVTPIANPDSGTTPYGTPLSVSAAEGVLADDLGTQLTVTGHTDPAHGTVTVEADGAYGYTPDAGYAGTDSFQYSIEDQAGSTATATVTITVTQVATSFTASANPTSTTYGNTVQLAANGLPTNATGTVTFTAGGSTLCTTGQLVSGAASCTTAVRVPATYGVTGTYSGDAGYLGATATTGFSVTRASTSFTASANPSSTTYGNTVQLTASGLPSDATGTVTFAAGGSALCTTGQLSSGSASCTTSVLAPNLYPVTATYSGDTDYQGSTATTSFSISKVGTGFTASANPATTTYGNTVRLTASGLPSGAEGTVAFMADVGTLCTTGQLSSGSASCATAVLGVGTYGVTATYSGDATHQGSTANVEFVITAVTTSFAASASPSSTTYGNAVQLTASGLPSAATGLVTFTSGAAALCTTGQLNSGSASCTTAVLASDSYPVTATYSGDRNFRGSTATTSFSIGRAVTSFSASANPTSTDSGGTVQLDASDLPPTATGTVTFTDGGSTLCTTGQLSSGSASCTTGALATASYTVTATYTGDANFQGSTATTGFTVTPAPVLQLATSGTPPAAAVGTSYSLTLTPSLGSTGGPAGNDPVLTASLPSGETFAVAPTASGWSCGLSGGGSLLSCTSSSAPIPVGTQLPGITVRVEISSTGSLETRASLSDSADLATAAAATATVQATATPMLILSTTGTPSAAGAGTSYELTLRAALGGLPAGPAYDAPTLFATVPGGETFAAAPSAAGWSCSLSAGATVTTCAPTAAPASAGTVFPDLTATVDISEHAFGDLQTTAALADDGDGATTVSTTAAVNVTAPPVIVVATSGTPTTAPAGALYTLNVDVALASGGGPAYDQPIVTLLLPAGETFTAAPSIPGWDCILAAGGTTLTCTSTAATPIAPGTQLVSVSVQVHVAAGATGELIATVSAGDTGDGAALAVTAAQVGIQVATPATGARRAAPYLWRLGVLLMAAGLLLIVGSECRRRRRRGAPGRSR